MILPCNIFILNVIYSLYLIVYIIGTMDNKLTLHYIVVRIGEIGIGSRIEPFFKVFADQMQLFSLVGSEDRYSSPRPLINIS